MTVPTPPRRRWFQFGLGELFILATITTIIWVLSARCWKLEWLNGWEGQPAMLAWSEPDDFDVFRRGTIGSVTLVVIWFACRAMLRRWKQSATQL
jgi:hypothetical protein